MKTRLPAALSLALSSLSLLLLTGGASGERIIDGRPLSRSGATVALVDKKSNSYRGYFCAGTLLRPRWVLTARHCLLGGGVRSFDVVTGRHDLLKRNGQRIAPAKIYYPPISQEAYLRDIALVYLSKKSKVKTRALGSESLEAGEGTFIQGWGAGRYHYPRLLQQARVDILPNQICEGIYESFSRATMICAGREAGGADACWGDSGGPLIAGGKIYALVSFGGWECGFAGMPTVYAKINAPWIKKRLSNPPRDYPKIKPGQDTSSEPRPFVLWQIFSTSNPATQENNMLIIVSSNFTVKVAKARIRGAKGIQFCSQDFCVKNGQWFNLEARSGRRHTEIFFDRGNYECPTVDLFAELKHPRKKYWKDSFAICGRGEARKSAVWHLSR